MKKNIKDYIHLYIGCKMQHDSDRCGFEIRGVHGDKVCLYGDWSGGTHPQSSAESWVNLNEVKLILRPISDIKKEENEEITKLTEEMNERFEKDEITEGDIYSEITRICCKKGFDVFQLLDEEFCIDEKIHNANMTK